MNVYTNSLTRVPTACLAYKMRLISRIQKYLRKYRGLILGFERRFT